MPLRKLLLGPALVTGAAASMVHGCAPVPAEDCGSQHNCAAADAGNVDAPLSSEESSNRDSGCDGTKAPHDNPCVVSESYAVFVSPLGADSGLGTRAAPLQTIGHGMDVAKAIGKRVYVCAGSYDETLVVGASRDGVSVYGGFDCGTWSYGPTNRVNVAPSEPGYALAIDGLTAGATFEDVEFDAPRASLSDPGASSVAALVSGSGAILFERVVLVAGNGTDGAPGASAADHADGGTSGVSTNWFGTSPAYAELNGYDATASAGGLQKVCSCPDTRTSTGGQGGSGEADGGQLPGPGLPPVGPDGGNETPGLNARQCSMGGAGSGGADGLASASSPSGAWGMLGAGGWSPAVGAGGSNGAPGQGGGGGGSGPADAGAGGGGACGGCGGSGGQGGAGGGSSIALLSFQSSVTLVDCTLTANNAGRGGAGGNGEPGQAGSLVGGSQRGSGCQGGGGGSGSGGNGGQGGPGGLSLGIGYVGAAPTFDGAPVVPGQALARVTLGAGGLGGGGGSAGAAAATTVGQPQAGAAGAAGIPGASQAALNL